MFRTRRCFVSELCECHTHERVRLPVTRLIIRFIGDTVVLQCRTNGSASMSWSHGFIDSIAWTSIGVSSGYPRLSLNTTTEGQFDLLINSTQQQDAGFYTCLIFEPIVKAELILLGMKRFVLISLCCCSLCKLCTRASLVSKGAGSGGGQQGQVPLQCCTRGQCPPMPTKFCLIFL